MLFSRERLIQYMEKCSESYIIRSDPRRFLSQMELFEKVSGSDNISVSIEVRSDAFDCNNIIASGDITTLTILYLLLYRIPSLMKTMKNTTGLVRY